jgi:hypothetical protein
VLWQDPPNLRTLAARAVILGLITTRLIRVKMHRPRAEESKSAGQKISDFLRHPARPRPRMGHPLEHDP